jgi:putative membrane protein
MKFSHVRTAFFGIALMSPALLLAQFDPMAVPSQSQPNRAQQTPNPAAQDSGPNAGDVGQVMADKMFLRKAAEGGIAEVKFGQLAAQK